eukprot:sb/3477055/
MAVQPKRLNERLRCHVTPTNTIGVNNETKHIVLATLSVVSWRPNTTRFFSLFRAGREAVSSKQISDFGNSKARTNFCFWVFNWRTLLAPVLRHAHRDKAALFKVFKKGRKF